MCVSVGNPNLTVRQVRSEYGLKREVSIDTQIERTFSSKKTKQGLLTTKHWNRKWSR